MAGIWTGSNLLTRFAEKYGFRDTNGQARVLEWMNEIQEDICEAHKWSFLKFKMKKQLTAGSQEVDLSVQIPAATTVAVAAGGALTVDTNYLIKTTFLIFSESTREYDSLESEASVASSVAATTTGNLTINLTAIPLYSGLTSVKPAIIHRRIYLKKGTGIYALHSTITDNTTTILSIAADTTSLIEPPEYSLVQCLADEDPFLETEGLTLYSNNLDDILKYDPNLSSTGTPQYYSRVTETKMFIYPRPSSALTLSYWVYRIPARIFNDADRVIHLDHSLKKVLDEGVDWKGKAWKQDAQASEILSNYEQLKVDAIGNKNKVNGQFGTVKVVC